MAREGEIRCGEFTVDDLTTAAANGDLTKVRDILQTGVDVNGRNSFGRTAVQVMTHTYVDLADELLCAGADPNVKDISHRHIGGTSTYRTICHDVAESGSLPTLQCLLRHGADISLRDKRGNTPAHVAAKSGHFKLVQYLLCGMATNVTNDLKRTPLDYLDSKEDPGCRQWVERRRSTPATLRTLCVVVVRSALGPGRLKDLSRLQLPGPVVSCVQLQNLRALEAEIDC
ncbi:cyclin-dependent kinase 4 inhibitor C-like [Haliotis rufescens]|uniref:cyclin-dependent kinase 4 inhibitor C-like n=1 Tax=Haliotis rufescens TaxID=6454 RepID=UPI001EAFEA9D|nr:cyclin-dependent kinase 4 inhibitor C-like [Haliotis rufescens]XP_046327781.1 cyclin-dependent kinase 4 inhibitor C-like [Haliotis rufescens]